MRSIKHLVIALTVCFPLAFLAGCSDDDVSGYERDHGYVQFKLYKEASYESDTRAVTGQLDYLYQATKVNIRLDYDGQTISQTLTLSAADKDMAEFGMRSAKLKLLAGGYRVILFTLYDANDEELYVGSPGTDNQDFEVVTGGLVMHDLTVNVVPRGKVHFTIVKNMDDFVNTPQTRAAVREYTFDEITTISITVRGDLQNDPAPVTFERLPVKYYIHFDESGEKPSGYQTLSLACDTLLTLKAANYTITQYEVYDRNKVLLERNSDVKGTKTFTVVDNRTTEADVPVTLYESDEYIKDYYALREIYESLGGDDWYYDGQNFQKGIKWNFNMDPDLWGAQPGVQVHDNGRVASLNLSNFGIRGELSPAIGQLTQLVQLYLGDHGETNIEYDPSIAADKSLVERSRTRMERHKEYLQMIHPPAQVSEPIARAMTEKGIRLSINSLYDRYGEDEIFDPSTGRQNDVGRKDVTYGRLTNGLRKLPDEIGLLTNLEYLYIANGELEELPASMANLTSLTDIEIYNCPKMTRFPTVLAQMPELIAVNVSNNYQWDPQDLHDGLDAIAKGPAREKIQAMYCVQTQLEEVPESFSNLKKLGLLDLSDNRIHTLHPLGSEVAPIMYYISNNQITSFPVDADGVYCAMEDVEDFVASNNKLTVFPNIFSAKSNFMISGIDFSYNDIRGFEGYDEDAGVSTFKGVYVEILTLTGNENLKVFPKALSDTDSAISYIILRGCGIEEFPEGCFAGKYSNWLQSLDLSYNKLTKLPSDITAITVPYLYGLDVSYNALNQFPFMPLNCQGLTVYALRGQRDSSGNRSLRQWPTGIGRHGALLALYLGSNDLRTVEDNYLYMLNYLDISDNPNISFDASEICDYWKAGRMVLVYDKDQRIRNCDAMLQ